MRKITIGQEVSWRGGFGSLPPVPAIVTGIEHCQNGNKYGEPVTEISVELKDKCVFTLSNNHWAYGKQIELT